MKSFSSQLYFVLDPAHCGTRDPVDLASAAIAGGVDTIQLRVKGLSDRDTFAIGQKLASVCRRENVLFLINDRIDMAMALKADGVHLGQDDLSPDIARRLLGDEAIIGLTVRDTAELQAVDRQLVQYLGIGGVFATTTKNNARQPIGLSGLQHLVSLAGDLPAVAIAGINASNAGEVIATGVGGIAVVSAIAGADDPEAAASALCRIIEEAKRSMQA